ILIVEDEEKLARFIELELEHEGYQVTKALDGREGLASFEAGSFDLVLLDIMLPALSGIEVLRRIRQVSEIPVILLTARDAVVDKVTGLDGGADDYITKPFAIEELLARIRVALRNKAAPVKDKNNLLEAGRLSLNSASREVKVDREIVELTRKEFDLLEFLLQNKNIVMERSILLERIWGYDFAGETNSVDVYIRYLRSKLEEPYNLKLIQTVRGVGYVIRDEE
ncbi:MAG: response regulator transcription factor, partial [Halarsenatibacteraceae bacterium]